MTTLKFRCRRIDIEEKDVRRYQETPLHQTRVNLYFESVDLVSTESEWASVTITVTKERFEALKYEIGKVYELALT